MISFFISYFLFLRGKNSLGREQFISSHGSRKCCPWSPYPVHLGRASWWREQAVHRGTAPFMAGQQAERRGTHVYIWPSFPCFIFSGFGALRMVPLIFGAHISLSIIFFSRNAPTETSRSVPLYHLDDSKSSPVEKS